MSAYIESKAHIDALVTAAGAVELGEHSSGLSWYHDGERYEMSYSDHARASEIGRMLWAENLASIHARYPDTAETDSNYPGPAGFESVQVTEYQFVRTARLEPVVVLKAIDGYRYQSCEHEGWETSQAFAFCRSLEHKMIGQLPGYDESRAWSLDEGDVRGNLALTM